MSQGIKEGVEEMTLAWGLEEWIGVFQKSQQDGYFFDQRNNNKEILLPNHSNNSSHLFTIYNVVNIVLNVFTSLVP